jgi:pyridoxamine 5'-phosphate oxidase
MTPSDLDAFPDDPLLLFAAWFEEARGVEGIAFANAVCLSTIDDQGYPDARMVLMKEMDGEGFVFYTNRNSSKGRSLRGRPRAALTFYWEPLHRQVRVQGPVTPVSAAEADAYFATRPRESRIAAWASDQSAPLASRAALEARVEEMTKRFRGGEVPRPPHWSGFRLHPLRIEFWTSRPHRLHERVLYRVSEMGRPGEAGSPPIWTKELLNP